MASFKVMSKREDAINKIMKNILETHGEGLEINDKKLVVEIMGKYMVCNKTAKDYLVIAKQKLK